MQLSCVLKYFLNVIIQDIPLDLQYEPIRKNLLMIFLRYSTSNYSQACDLEQNCRRANRQNLNPLTVSKSSKKIF